MVWNGMGRSSERRTVQNQPLSQQQDPQACEVELPLAPLFHTEVVVVVTEHAPMWATWETLPGAHQRMHHDPVVPTAVCPTWRSPRSMGGRNQQKQRLIVLGSSGNATVKCTFVLVTQYEYDCHALARGARVRRYTRASCMATRTIVDGVFYHRNTRVIPDQGGGVAESVQAVSDSALQPLVTFVTLFIPFYHFYD